MRLVDLRCGERGVVKGIDLARMDCQPELLRRLQDIGFVHGEEVRMLAQAPWSAEPVLVGLGGTRFALRRAEAEQVILNQIIAK